MRRTRRQDQPSDHRQLITGAIVLGLSIGLSKHQVIDKVPPVTGFSAFVGAFGLIVAGLGLLSLWVDKVPNTVVLAADTLATLFYIAAGIVSPAHSFSLTRREV